VNAITAAPDYALRSLPQGCGGYLPPTTTRAGGWTGWTPAYYYHPAFHGLPLNNLPACCYPTTAFVLPCRLVGGFVQFNRFTTVILESGVVACYHWTPPSLCATATLLDGHHLRFGSLPGLNCAQYVHSLPDTDSLGPFRRGTALFNTRRATSCLPPAPLLLTVLRYGTYVHSAPSLLGLLRMPAPRTTLPRLPTRIATHTTTATLLVGTTTVFLPPPRRLGASVVPPGRMTTGHRTLVPATRATATPGPV